VDVVGAVCDRAEEEMATNSASGFRFQQVKRVRVYVQNHVACCVLDCRVPVRCAVVQQLGEFFTVVYAAVACSEAGALMVGMIVGLTDLAHVLCSRYLFLINERCVVGWWRKLNLGAKRLGSSWVWSRRGIILEVVDRLLDVVWHGKLYGTLFIVPVEGYSTV
jgi:hypothetical protein